MVLLESIIRKRATAMWFWKRNVAPRPGVQQFHFGDSTMAINGGLECNGPYQNKAKQRFGLYVNVLKAFNIYAVPIETGCYS
jgi:hypothetical protein